MKASQSSGLFRSGPFLVIDRDRAEFPSRCMHCNGTADVAMQQFHLWSSQTQAWTAIGKTVELAANARSASMHLPVCKRCAGKKKRRLIVTACISFGLLGVAGLSMAAVAQMDGPGKDDHPMIMVPLVLGLASFFLGLIVLMVAGFMVFFVGTRRIVNYMDHKHIWTREVNSKWLKEFPQWQGEDWCQLNSRRFFGS